VIFPAYSLTKGEIMNRLTINSLLCMCVVLVCGLFGCGGGGNAPNNSVTAAKAGTAQNVVAGSVVALDGSQSTGADGSLITYQWSMVSKPAGSSVTILNSTDVNPTFTTDLPGTYTLKLIIIDGKSVSSEDTVTITVTSAGANAVPVAQAGTAQNTVIGTVVTLDGSASSDANDDLLTYTWSFTSRPTGSGATLTSATAAKPSFTADMAGVYVLSLVVNDGNENSLPISVTINTSSANAAPVAVAGFSRSVVTGSVVTLDGSTSSDANKDLLTYSWSFTSKPVGSSAALSSATVAKPSFTADVAGAYVVNLLVNDGKLNSAVVAITITASSAVTARPIASAKSIQDVVTGAVVALDGSGSDDADGDPLTYSWSITTKPAGSSAALSSTTIAKPSFTTDVAGVYVLGLVVSDGLLTSLPATITITASGPTLQLSRVGYYGNDLLSMPYTQSSVATMSVLAGQTATVATFKLTATGAPFTVSNLSAIDSTGRVVPSFVNLSNGQIITASSPATFSLISPSTNSNLVRLIYSFTIAETGKTFSYDVNLTTN
jgi:hypothetical protein